MTAPETPDNLFDPPVGNMTRAERRDLMMMRRAAGGVGWVVLLADLDNRFIVKDRQGTAVMWSTTGRRITASLTEEGGIIMSRTRNVDPHYPGLSDATDPQTPHVD